MKHRSIPLSIIFCILTCGIYGLYWFVCLTDELNFASGNVQDTNGGMALILTLITCNIYGIYWAWRMGEKLEALRMHNGQGRGSYPILFLVLSLFGLNIISFALIQDNLNNIVY